MAMLLLYTKKKVTTILESWGCFKCDNSNSIKSLFYGNRVVFYCENPTQKNSLIQLHLIQ